jgi:20S proteasome subunit beta 3
MMRWVRDVLFLALILAPRTVTAQQQQDPMTLNGGSVLAMAGKNCVAVAVDKRFGSANALVNITPRKILRFGGGDVLVAFTGLEGDVQSLAVELAAQVAAKYSRGLGMLSSQSRASMISATSMASLTSHVLYQRQRRSSRPFYVEPLVVGLEPIGWMEEEDENEVNETNGNDDSDDFTGEDNNSVVSTPSTNRKRRCCYRPYLCALDMIGAKSEAKDFVCAGAASDSMYGTAEALWRPDLTANELLAVCGKAFLSALERDCLSGYGAVIYVLTPEDGIVEYDLTGRND